MAYTVLARKWRPKIFAEMVGQQIVVDALTRALTLGRIHHAYLFTGTRGVGKTTTARILAKCLCCEQPDEAIACGICAACSEIDAGCYPELIEIDAASRTRVEETRELLDNVSYLPTRGKFKIYLIDEVHMLSTHSFNALLKTLEEPPSHVKFLFATTDPQKLPATVLSRCLQYHLKPVMPEVIAAHLKSILAQEAISAETEALNQIAQSAEGSVRDALSLLDQAIAYGAGTVTIAATRSMLGIVAPEHIFALLAAIAQNDGEKLVQQIDALALSGFSFAAILADMLALLQRVATLQIVPTAKIVTTHETQYQQLARCFSPEIVQLFYSIVLLGRRDLSLAPDQRSAFEMVMLRLFAFSIKQPRVQESTVKPHTIDIDKKPAPIVAPTAPVQTSPVQIVQTQTIAPTTSHVHINQLSWAEVIEELKLVGMTSALAKHSILTGYENDQLELALSTQHAALYNDMQPQRIGDALTRYLGRPTKVRFTIGNIHQETPIIATQRAEQTAKAELIERMQNDPGVKELEKQLGAVLDVKSIEAL